MKTQKQMSHTVTYGIEKGYNKGKVRYFVICDGRRTSLDYAKKEFAMKKAYEFCIACHKNFVRHDNTQVCFVHKQM